MIIMNNKPMSEVAPLAKLIGEENPPCNQDVWLFTKYGTGYRGRWSKDAVDVIAWCPLPKLTPDQKITLKQKGILL